MTALGARASAGAGAGRRPLPGRLLRLELRHNVTLLLAPLLAVLLWLASDYGRVLRAPVALWSSRSIAMQGSLQVLGPLAAGAAAWMAGREARRNLAGLTASAARPQCSRQLLTWAATALWALACYAAATAVMFGVTAQQATWGGPLWWPVAVGAAGVLAFCSLGFTLGAVIPSRFTAPLLAIGLLFGLQLGLFAAYNARSGYGWVGPAVGSLDPGASVYFPVDPGLSIVQLIILAGVSAAALGTLALPAGAGGPWLRRAAAGCTAAGMLAAGTGVALAGTARAHPLQGTIIPALHNAAADRPLGYQPVCSRGQVPVCLHPALRALLPAVAADLAPLTAQLAGLPGAPVRAELSPVGAELSRLSPGGTALAAAARGPGGAVLRGHPPVLYLGMAWQVNTQGPMTPAQVAKSVRFAAAMAIVGGTGGKGGTPAQDAAAIGLLRVAGDRPPVPLPAQVIAAAGRFAALPPATRHGWLAAHLPALRAGRVSLRELP